LNGITSTKYHANLSRGSKVISVGYTGRQTGDLIIVLSFSKGSTIKGHWETLYCVFRTQTRTSRVTILYVLVTAIDDKS
jgi:hypothetical protein